MIQAQKKVLTHLQTAKNNMTHIATTAGIICLSLSLSACLDFERFRHEKYTCSAYSLDIEDIIIRNAKAGETVTISGFQRNREGLIISISDETAVIETGDLKLFIDRKKGSVSALNGNRYRHLKCKQTIFTI
jgi:hypothetical protein